MNVSFIILAVIGFATASGLCTTISVNVRGHDHEVHKSLLETNPKSHLTHLLKDYKCGDDPVFINRDPYFFSAVLEFMRGNIMTRSLHLSVKAFTQELDFYMATKDKDWLHLMFGLSEFLKTAWENEELRQQIKHDKAFVIDRDKVIAALKKENRVLRQQAKIGNFFTSLFMLGLLGFVYGLVYDAWKLLKYYFT